MTLLDVLTAPNPILKQRCDDIDVFDEDLKSLVVDMFETMRKNNGVGLAGPQVGILQRLFVCEAENKNRQKEKLVCINPRLRYSGDELESEEGCLSIPGKLATVTRYSNITMDAFNLEGESYTLKADGFLAIVLQHEYDHLNGILVTDNPIKISELEG